MGLFDFPRIHVWGTMVANPGTGNNNSATPGDEIVVTSDTERVRAVTRGMSDQRFRDWMTETVGPFVRCQWNYFGDFTFRFIDVRVGSVQLSPGNLVTDPAIDPLVGGEVYLNHAMLVDVNPEGFNTTQIFAESLELRAPGALTSRHQAFVSRKPTTATTRWLNWYRNVSYHGLFGLPPDGLDGKVSSGGAGGASVTFQCGIPISKADLQENSKGKIDDPSSKNAAVHRLLADPRSPGAVKMVNELSRPDAIGLIFRYSVYLCYPKLSDTELAVLFKKGERIVNPAYGRVMGTISPWYKDEPSTITMGRFLKPATYFDNPYRHKDSDIANGKNQYYLSPCIAKAKHGFVSIDTANCLPEDGPDGAKFSLGTVSLGFRDPTPPGSNPRTNTSLITPIGTLQNDQSTYLRQGGIYDLPLGRLTAEQQGQIADGGEGELVLTSSSAGVLLYEPEFMAATDCSCAYLDELSPGKTWVDSDVRDELRAKRCDALKGEVELLLHRRGLSAPGQIEVTVEQWKSTPTADPNDPDCKYRFPILLDKTVVSMNGGSGKLLLKPTDGPGIRTYRFVPPGLWPNPIDNETLGKLQFQEYYMDLRVLPYDNYSGITDADLTWDLMFTEIFRYYYLILPAMSEYLDLTDPTIWRTPTALRYLMNMTDPKNWDYYNYMPRTRDLSKCRRDLLVRFCTKMLPQ